MIHLVISTPNILETDQRSLECFDGTGQRINQLQIGQPEFRVVAERV